MAAGVTWTKLSDDFADDCWTLSDKAFRLHVEGLVWNNRKLVDLRLSAEDVRRFAKHPEAVTELLAVGWWSAVEGGYVINHHATYQRSREDVLKQQAANQENGRKGGRPPKAAREQAKPKVSPITQSLSESVTQSVSPLDSDHGGPGHAATLTETQSLSESKSERDRTGRARGKEAPQDSQDEDPWAAHPVAVPGHGALASAQPAARPSECMACIWGDGVHERDCEAA